MDRKGLDAKLEKKKVPKDAYSLAGGLPNECFCMEKGKQWEVYYSERGLKTQLKEFATEDEACEYMYNKLLGIFLR